ncbi:helix-turn-helix transcriptional regulator [Kribbella sp. NPDC026611]|uniref:helix-turn-helix domain-containing protein n=1 Tax=Kribbella sp. NPDC026611 TaxID=3154911 RepID=UPI0033E179F4
MSRPTMPATVPEATEAASSNALFGARLRECRQAAGLSLRQLAGRVGYDHSYLSQVERGHRPGSAGLARHCDRELGTGSQLLTAFEQQQRRPAPATPTAQDPLATAWHELTRDFAGAPDTLDILYCIPPARRLPELISELQIHGNDDLMAAQLSVLTAEALTACGETPQAQRWWWAAQKLADSTEAGRLQSTVRAREAISGLAERRPLPHLLELTDEALASAQQAVQARAARALVLADLGRSDEARLELQRLIGDADRSDAMTTQPTGWTTYQLRWAEGRVCARLGYGAAACVLLQCARELCPPDRIGDRARLDLSLAEALAVEGEVAAALALALRVLVELPDEWHDLYLSDDADRVLTAVQQQDPAAPGVAELRRLGGRSVGSGSKRR